MNALPASAIRFGPFVLQVHERRLLAAGEPVALGGRAFDLLLALAERPGRLVSKADLMDLVWPGLVVQENNLAAQMSALRKALGSEVIATIPGRGYRFVARIDEAAQDHAGATIATAATTGHAPADPRPPTPVPEPPRTNLSADLPELVGRAEDLRALDALIDQQRLVSVVGAGGVGKSLLAQHALAARRSRYAHGVCWVELATVTDAAALPGAVAAALGVQGGQGDAMSALVGAVSSLELLVALDNAEHLLADVATLVRTLLAAAPGLRIVVTSQAPLHLATEQVVRVGPLAVPDGALTAAEALRHGAVALLVQRARAIDRHFELDDAQAAAAAAVCRALDGLPLAIELAAARAPLLGLRQLATLLHDRFALLTRGHHREAPARQRTLRAALEWSHDLLSPDQQRAFRRLGVVAGSASLPLALALLADDPADGPNPPAGATLAEVERIRALDLLDALVDRSLVAVLPRPGEGEPRYRLLETPRAFALEQLAAAGEQPALRRRHARALATRFDAAYAAFFGGSIGADEWHQRIEPELDNARDALAWARAEGSAEAAEVELTIATVMLRALPPSLHVERMALADACERRLAADVPEALQLRTWLELACVWADPHKVRSRAAATQALALARRHAASHPEGAPGPATQDDERRFLLYHALCRAASGAAQAGDLVASRPLLDEARQLEHRAWPPHRRLWWAEAAQWHARMSGDSAEALAHGRRLLALDRERGSHASIAMGNLIDAELAAGHADDAASLGAVLVASLEGSRHEYSLAFARINLLAALLALGETERARPVAEAAWSKAAAFELQHAAAAYLALWCAQQQRDEAAVLLAAYSEAQYAARGEAREVNETAATHAALALARSRLAPERLGPLQAAGARLADGDIGAVAFG